MIVEQSHDHWSLFTVGTYGAANNVNTLCVHTPRWLLTYIIADEVLL